MSAQTQSVADKLEALDVTLTLISEKRQLLRSYRDEKQRFADLVTEVQADLDALMAASETQLKGLRDTLNAAYPPA